MGAYLVEQDASLLTSLDLAVTTRALLAANPLTASLAAGFDAWLVEWRSVFGQEIDLRIETTSAAALVAGIDDDLDDLSDETSKATLIVTKNDRSDPEFVFYFKGTRPSDFKRPLMGSQYQQMTAWITHMAASPYPALADIGKRIEVKIGEADKAIATSASAEQKSRDFRLTGARRQLVDKFNALRKATEGTLQEMPHAHPELKLPASFAERFLRAARPAQKAPTAADLKAQLDAAQKSAADLEAAYEAALKAEADAAVEKANKAAQDKELADAEAELKKQAEKVAELKAKLGKD